MESFVAGFGGAGAGVPTKDPFDDSLPPTGNKDEEDAVSGFSLRRPLNGSCVGGDVTAGAAATAVVEETGVVSAKGVSSDSKSTSELTV